ncbi:MULTISPECIES: sigma-54 interaction domain-containing protein [Peribacillus]|uniref:sigma-54 interaction domain-containing protein n=1 Tax=Peribacillus TaxID=2675229 RepID=UPI001F4DCAB3|nr:MULTISPECIES: sigma 54-interacting transcriptional regulator [unclassified Peribacillus]MCK1982688.1 sigma 54-interacting transcriptional regulator [Peribacillus sp. Aquil_B1]MCK2008197.1 sigma 54-interacting transcriptional regulator [Peribacillus sp. Aquil_B8]
MPSEFFNTSEVLEAILETIDEGIHVIDPKGQTIFYNEVAANHDGMKRSEVLGKPLLEAFPSLNHKSSTLLRVIKSEKPIYNYSQSYVNAHGRIIETLNTTLPIYVDGFMIGAIEIAKDYSSLKQLSERLADLESSLKTIKSPERKKPGTGGLYSFTEILTIDAGFKGLISQGKKAARSSSSVLVYGESGVGKELFVQSIHQGSSRSKEPFIAQNCAALPENLLESLLFGTAKGSYTGAVERQGLFELANGGTLFLDELQSMPIDLQAKLLRVLEDGFIRRIGGTKSVQVDVRIMAAMNVDPKKAVSDNELRPDLFYRLNVLSYELPPLRERIDDIELLTEHFISIFNSKLGLSIKGVDEQTKVFFREYHWPGNVRELKHTVEFMMNHTEDDVLNLADLPQSLKKRTPSKKILPLREAMIEMETKLITEALLQTNGNVFQASKLLQIPRQTLQYKIKKHI